MRILTPAEVRQVEAIKWLIAELHNPSVVANDMYRIEINSDNQELWLNILDIVLDGNEVLKASWQGKEVTLLELMNPNG